MKPKPQKKVPPSLTGHVQAGLSALKLTLSETLKVYAERLNSEIDEVESKVKSMKVTDEHVADLRDMLSLLRNLQVKAERGRRKDLKKIDSLVGDLNLLTAGWRSTTPKHAAPKSKSTVAPKRSGKTPKSRSTGHAG